MGGESSVPGSRHSPAPPPTAAEPDSLHLRGIVTSSRVGPPLAGSADRPGSGIADWLAGHGSADSIRGAGSPRGPHARHLVHDSSSRPSAPAPHTRCLIQLQLQLLTPGNSLRSDSCRPQARFSRRSSSRSCRPPAHSSPTPRTAPPVPAPAAASPPAPFTRPAPAPSPAPAPPRHGPTADRRPLLQSSGPLAQTTRRLHQSAEAVRS